MYMWGTDVYGATIPELGEDEEDHSMQTFATPVSIDINDDDVDGMTDSIDLDINGDGVQGTKDGIYQVTAGKDTAAAMFETADGTQQKVYMWGDNSGGEFGWGEDEGVVDPENSITSATMIPQLVYQANIENLKGADINETALWTQILLIISIVLVVVLIILAIVL